ncbi:MAG: hypothetical protein EP329_17845 [Deltaproteobacteria bacterium]|nr:MAG: hypothetical protein EP329_17845 [Deltaproteobacteria bacterium]
MSHTRRYLRSRIAQTGLLVGALMLLMGTNDDNGCAPDPGGQGECTTASDCTGDPGVDCVGAWACNAGECTFECGSEPVGCYGDQDCSGGLVCNAAEICLSPPGCEAGQPCPAVCYGHCVEPEPRTGCYSDGQCAPGEHCTTSDGDCKAPPGCESGESCPTVCYGECVPDQTEVTCYSDADCGVGEQCNSWDYCLWPSGGEYDASGAPADMACLGRCEPVAPSCQSDADCDAGEYCGCAMPPMTDGLVACMLQCIPDPNAQCDADRPCPAGMACSGGVCVEEPKGCWSDYDCGANEQCNTWDYCGMPYDCANGADCLIACQGVCEPKPTQGCQSDDQCGPNQHCEVACMACDCDPSWGDCYCPEFCEGTCVADAPVPCYSDDECGAHEYCGCAGGGYYGGGADGVTCMLQCVPKPFECTSDADCDGGRCNFELCEAVDCGPDMDCGTGEACFGYCEPTPQYECDSDDDCASGVCEFVVCEAYAADPMPCQPDDAGNCVERPIQPYCQGYCKDPGPMECGPNGECPDGYSCGCGSPYYPAAGLPAGIMCYPMCVPDATTCYADNDCAQGEVCVSGACQAGSDPCQSDADCGAGQRCEATVCPAMPCSFDPATGESICPPCYGQCVEDTTSACSTDAECSAGQYCAIDYCVTACPACVPGAVCPPCETQCFGSCADQEWPQECNTDGDCDAGESCQCTANPACPECDACFFQCLPTNTGECASDTDCGENQACDFICAPCAAPEDGTEPVDCPCFGMCVDVAPPIDPPTECQTDADCAEGSYCEQGPCPYFMPCTPEFGCPSCGGTCQEKPTEPNPCFRTGCSGQVCAAEPVYTTCEYLPQYACYELAECGLNADGTCGWQANDAFAACLDTP